MQHFWANLVQWMAFSNFMNNPQRFRSQGGMLENHVSNNVSLFNPMKMQLHLDALQILLRNISNLLNLIHEWSHPYSQINTIAVLNCIWSQANLSRGIVNWLCAAQSVIQITFFKSENEWQKTEQVLNWELAHFHFRTMWSVSQIELHPTSWKYLFKID